MYGHAPTSHAAFVVITPPASEVFSLADARAFLRIDVAGFPSDDHTQDSFILDLIQGVREWVELETDHAIGIQTMLTASMSFYQLGENVNAGYLGYGFESDLFGYRGRYGPALGIELPHGPIRSIDSIKYLTYDGQDLTVDPTSYRITQLHPQRVTLKNGFMWPSGASLEPESVRITYVGGYAPVVLAGMTTVEAYADNYADDYSGSAVALPPSAPDPYPLPGNLMSAMRLLIGHLYINRSATVMTLKAEDLPLGVRALIWPSRASIGI